MCVAVTSCLRLFWHCERAAASRTFWTAGTSRAIRIAMIAITTNSSINVNAPRAAPYRRLMIRPSQEKKVGMRLHGVVRRRRGKLLLQIQVIGARGRALDDLDAQGGGFLAGVVLADQGPGLGRCRRIDDGLGDDGHLVPARRGAGLAVGVKLIRAVLVERRAGLERRAVSLG